MCCRCNRCLGQYVCRFLPVFDSKTLYYLKTAESQHGDWCIVCKCHAVGSATQTRVHPVPTLRALAVLAVFAVVLNIAAIFRLLLMIQLRNHEGRVRSAGPTALGGHRGASAAALNPSDCPFWPDSKR